MFQKIIEIIDKNNAEMNFSDKNFENKLLWFLKILKDYNLIKFLFEFLYIIYIYNILLSVKKCNLSKLQLPKMFCYIFCFFNYFWIFNYFFFIISDI